MKVDLLTHIRGRCTEEGDCWIWTGAVSEVGLPRMAKTSTRRTLWRALNGDIDSRMMVSCRCGEKLCVNPEHLCLRTKATVVKQTARSTSTRQKRSRTMTLIARAKGKLNADAVVDIRSSSETLKVLAERYGVHFTLISKVRRNEAWRDHTSPFAGPGARP